MREKSKISSIRIKMSFFTWEWFEFGGSMGRSDVNLTFADGLSQADFPTGLRKTW